MEGNCKYYYTNLYNETCSNCPLQRAVMEAILTLLQINGLEMDWTDDELHNLHSAHQQTQKGDSSVCTLSSCTAELTSYPKLYQNYSEDSKGGFMGCLGAIVLYGQFRVLKRKLSVHLHIMEEDKNKE